MSEKMFGFQGSPEQVKKAEVENLTDEQKAQSDERHETLEAGFKVGKELSHFKNTISIEEINQIIEKNSGPFIIQLRDSFNGPVEKLRNVTIKEVVKNDVRINYCRDDGTDDRPRREGLRFIKSIINQNTNERIWDDENDSYEDLKTKKTTQEGLKK